MSDQITPADGAPKAKEFIINLDEPPASRWAEVGREYAQLIKEAIKNTTEGVPEVATKVIEFIGKELDNWLPATYKEELQGLAETVGSPLGDLFFYNLSYDITAHCTSTVVQTKDGRILHARNLDMPRDPEFQKLLPLSRQAVIAVNFQKQGQTVYSGVTIAGYIGLLTGQKPNSFTVTLNERRTGSIWLNILELLKDLPGSSVGLILRDTLADPNMTFRSAVDKLTSVPLIAACYLTIGGINPGEGAVISRDRRGTVEPLSDGLWKLDANSGAWYLLQTNNDHWTKLPNIQPPDSNKDSYERRNTGDEAMNAVGQANIDPANVYKVLSTLPVLNETTIYTAVMSAGEPSLFDAWVRSPPTGAASAAAGSSSPESTSDKNRCAIS